MSASVDVLFPEPVRLADWEAFAREERLSWKNLVFPYNVWAGPQGDVELRFGWAPERVVKDRRPPETATGVQVNAYLDRDLPEVGRLARQIAARWQGKAGPVPDPLLPYLEDSNGC